MSRNLISDGEGS